ncbi:MAG: efflux RND transporter periplasmic adaptor subunit [Planctomycetes bacterium]|nr:efflux RND transporter periplasmic adaptor subunit [Planctomycetota bacterium]
MGRYVAIFIAALVLVLGAAYTVSYMSKVKRESAEVTSPSGAIPVETAAAARGVVEVTVDLPGSLRSPRSVRVVSKAQGKIVAKGYKKGEVVEAGRVLYEVEKETVEAMRKQAEAGVEAAEANLAQAKAAYKNAEAEYVRAKNLYREGSMTPQMLEGAETGYQAASGALAAAEAGLKGAQAARQLAVIAVEDATIRSPIGGRVVMDYDLHEGATVAPGMPVAEVKETASLKAVAPLPECYIGQVRENESRVHVKPEGCGETTDAVVTLLTPLVSEMTRAAEVEAVFTTPLDEQKREKYFPGQSCTMRLVLESQEGIVVPASAIVKRGDMDTVAVVGGGTAKVVPVKVGLKTSREAVVEDGLAEGDEVVSAGARLIKMSEDGGTKVKPVGGPAQQGAGIVR